MKQSTLKFFFSFLLMILSLLGSAQLISWNASSATGGSDGTSGNFGTSPWPTSTLNSNLTLSTGFTRGSSVTASGTPAASCWGGSGGWSSTGAADANAFYFVFTANSGYTVSLSSITGYTRHSSAGPTGCNIDYSVNGVAYTTAGTWTTSSTSGTTGTTGTVTLSGISALQNVAAGTTIKIRIAPTGATAGTWYLTNTSSVVLNGSVSVVASNTITTTATSLGPFCNSGSNVINVPFTSTGTFTGAYTVQLSNASGSFSSPTSLTTTGSSSPLSATIPSATVAGTGYRVRVVNSTPSTVSSNDNGSNIVINSVPATPVCSTPAAVCQGVAATITGAGSTGATTYTYWTASTGGSAITTSTTPPGTVASGNLTTPTTLAAGSDIYYVQGENSSCVSAARQAVTVTINATPATPAGTVTPAANPACTSTTVSYSSPSASIYWETSSSGTATTNPTTSAYTVSSTATIYARAYNGSCWSSGTANSGSVTINTAPSITSQPANSTIYSGANTTFSVTATNAASYQWQVNTGSGFSNITNTGVYTGATTSTLTITGATLSMSGYTYQVVIGGNSPCAGVTSSPAATLTVNTGPCVSESFANLCTSSCTPTNSSYGTRTWTGDNSFTWTATDSRSDQTISSATAICLRNGSLTSASVSGGISSITMTTQLDFASQGGTDLTVSVNGTNVGTIPFSSSVQTTTISGINVSGSVIISITTPGTGDRVSINNLSWVCYSGCSSPNAIAFVSQPANVIQDATMSTVTVKAYCTSGGATATSYTGAVTLTASGGGCGYVSQTVNAVAGIATFSGIVFDRSVQTGISLTASASGFSTVTSNTFNVTAPSGTASITTIIDEDFDGSTPTWSYTSSLVSDNTSLGTPYVGLKDYTTNPYGNSSFKKSLVKSHSANNNASQGESTNQILFSNVTGLGSYNSVQVSFLLGSLPSQSSGASGNGVDGNENMKIETSLDGGTTWNTLLTYYGFSNYLLPLSASGPATLAYNANASYNSNHANTSTQSAFVINLPSGTSQFRMRVTATDNREEENWAIDNIQIIGTTTGTGVQKPLPTASGGSYNSCTSTSLAIGVALTNTQGTTTYQWSPATNISSTTSAGPMVTVSSNTNYTVTATDADGCTASATDAITITTPSGNISLAGATVSAIEPSCPDATGWTYYTDPSDATKWLLGIYKNGNTFTANVDLTLETSPTYDLKSNSTLKKAVYTMGRYWNVTLATGSINGSTNPVKVRFFYNPADITTINTAALTLAQAWGLGSSNIHNVEWFKTNTGIIYNPSNNTYSDVPNKLSESSYTTSFGTINSISYAEYDGLQGFSGGGAGVRVSPGGYALPVEMIYLRAIAMDNSYIRLDWVTASETDNDGFEVERSTNGVDFEKIGFVKGQNNSSAETQYVFDDRNASPNAVYYYRLKQIDNDGDYDMTTIVSAMLLSQQGFVLEELKPNPASGHVVVNAVAAVVQTADVNVSDMLGRVVLSQPWELSPGLNGTQLDISGLASGTYNVTVRSVNGVFSKRLAVTK